MIAGKGQNTGKAVMARVVPLLRLPTETAVKHRPSAGERKQRKTASASRCKREDAGRIAPSQDPSSLKAAGRPPAAWGGLENLGNRWAPSTAGAELLRA